MRKLRIFAHTSLDGLISPGAPGEYSDEYANGAWTAPYRHPAGMQALLEAQGAGFDLVLGRRTYDLWSGFWPKAPNSPMADSLNAATKYVATHKPGSLGWGPVESLGTNIVDGIRSIKSKGVSDLILWGSSTVTPVLFEHGLVDEVVLIVYPLLLGRGKRFFSDTIPPRELALVSTKAMPTGAMLNSYRCVGPLRTG